GARVVAPGAHRARASTRRNGTRTPENADRPGDGGARSADRGGQRPARVTGGRLSPILRYHDDTKHHFDRFARSLGYLDWASQPAPFRSFGGAPEFLLPRSSSGSPVAYEDLFHQRDDDAVPAAPIDVDSIGDVLRHTLGLSAWKRFRGDRGESRWSLRVNP